MAAKAIAKGAAPSLPRRDYEAPSRYVGRVADISRQTGTTFLPASPEIHQIGLDDLRQELGEARRELSEAVGVAATATAITGITIRGSIAAYVEHIRRGFTLPDGHLRPWGRTKLDQLDSIARYLSDERFGGRDFLALDLCELSFGRCEEMFGVFRRRPPTLRSGLKSRMEPASARKLIKELGNFFDWLDGSEDHDWVAPRRFLAIKKTPDDLTAPELYDRRMAREKLVIPDHQLATLLEYAWPIDRLSRNFFR